MRKAEVKKEMVYNGLLALVNNYKTVPYDDFQWVKTREVADQCEMSIYSARIYLIALESDGRVHRSDDSLNNSLGWYPKLIT